MSASQNTTNYGFPKFLGTDKPAWLVDFNGAMDSIDSTIKTVEDVLTTVSGTVDGNTSDISQLITDVETASGNITTLQAVVSQNVLDITTLEQRQFVKNAIINGNFGVNQRQKSGTVILSAGQYGHDRWKAGASGCTYTFATTENVTVITITAGSLIQVIEGLNLETGTYILSWVGSSQGKIGAGSFSDTGVTGSVTGGTNLSIEFGTGTISKVRFNKGTTAIEWQTEAYDDVLRQCQRYYQRYGDPSSSSLLQTLANAGYATSSTVVYIPIIFQTPMRTSPTSIETYNVAFANYYGTMFGMTNITLDNPSIFGTSISANVSGINAGMAGRVIGANNANSYLAFNAEL